MQVSMVFSAMRALLNSPEKWVQNVNALARHEGSWYKVPPESPYAQRFCLQGAIMRVCGIPEVGIQTPVGAEAANAAMSFLHRLLAADGYPHGPVQWNDASPRTYEDVVLLLKRAQYEAEIDEAGR